MKTSAAKPEDTKKLALQVTGAYCVRLEFCVGKSCELTAMTWTRTTHNPPRTAPKHPPIGAPAEKVANAVDFVCEGGNEDPKIPSAEGLI